ncbi:hypothetical protein GCM10010260_04140 [Streptomyces filipinensis]|uniref:Uncharacterized protein n=1 Tax=Streptomyces filipinensis TaxID=66887 RepID=A0A918M936_9ACTN|nr:hypothetical protein GCM10010260_04140 [Streptomyces filipinensis]
MGREAARQGPSRVNDRKTPAVHPVNHLSEPPPRGYADMGLWTLIDCSSPTATQTANIDEPP